MPLKKELERVLRSISRYDFPGQVRCCLAPRCQNSASYVARISYSRHMNVIHKTIDQTSRRPACEEHAKKFAAKFGLAISEVS